MMETKDAVELASYRRFAVTASVSLSSSWPTACLSCLSFSPGTAWSGNQVPRRLAVQRQNRVPRSEMKAAPALFPESCLGPTLRRDKDRNNVPHRAAEPPIE